MQPEQRAQTDASSVAAGGGGPLAGTRVSVQPNMSVKDWPTDAGSLALEGYVALEDATAIGRLRAAGAMIAGSTHMSELGLGLADDTAGSAVSEGEIDLALVTDTLGEARVAGALAGVIGFKPSHGIVSRHGLIGLVPSMECYGILGRRADLIAAAASAMSGPDRRDFSMPEVTFPDFDGVSAALASQPVCGVLEQCLSLLDAGEARAFGLALARLQAAGCEIKQLSLPEFKLARTVHQVVGSVEASSSAGKYDGVRYGHRTASARDWNEMYIKSRSEAFGMPVKAYLFQGAYFQFDAYESFENATRIRRRIVRETEALFDDVDVLLLPTCRLGQDAGSAATVPQIYDGFALTLLANLIGAPTLSLPGWVRAGERDLGLQVVGPRLGDVRVLAAAEWLARVA